MEDLDSWMRTSADIARFSSPIDLMRPLPELEKDYAVLRAALPPANTGMPPERFPEEVDRVLSTHELPPEYTVSPLWRTAHQLFSQIRALRGDPGVIMWHPV